MIVMIIQLEKQGLEQGLEHEGRSIHRTALPIRAFDCASTVSKEFQKQSQDDITNRQFLKSYPILSNQI